MQPTLATFVVTLTMLPGAASTAPRSTLPSANSVCLVLSDALAGVRPIAATVLREVNGIWEPLGVPARIVAADQENCERIVLIKADEEEHGETPPETALGWVPFVEGRARRVIFVRYRRIREQVATIGPGATTYGVSQLLTAKFLGRVIAHEMGHVLLSSRAHESAGLMRARYRVHDVLRERPSSYGLSQEQRRRLGTVLNCGVSCDMGMER